MLIQFSPQYNTVAARRVWELEPTAAFIIWPRIIAFADADAAAEVSSNLKFSARVPSADSEIDPILGHG